MSHEHYFRDVSSLDKVDVYRLLELFGVTCPVAQHVVKKALAAGQRGHKGLRRDWQDIADSAKRRLQMLDEDDGADGLIPAAEALPAGITPSEAFRAALKAPRSRHQFVGRCSPECHAKANDGLGECFNQFCPKRDGGTDELDLRGWPEDDSPRQQRIEQGGELAEVYEVLDRAGGASGEVR